MISVSNLTRIYRLGNVEVRALVDVSLFIPAYQTVRTRIIDAIWSG